MMKNKGKDTNWTKNDLKPATRTCPRTQTQQHETETKLHDTTRLYDREYEAVYIFFGFLWTIGNAKRVTI